MSSNTSARTKAQEASSSSAKNFTANVITDLRSRDNWMKIFNAVAVHDRSINKSAFALGNRLALYHNVKGGRCDPGIPELAAEFGVSERTIDRGIKALTSTGWISRKRGGRYDTAGVVFHMPDASAITDNMVSSMEDVPGAMADSPYPTDSASIPDTQGDVTYEQRNRVEEEGVPNTTNSESAAQPRAPSMESLLQPRDVTPSPDAAPIPAKSTEVDATPDPKTSSSLCASFDAPEILGKEDRCSTETPPAGLLPESGLPGVTRDGAALDQPAKVARYYIVGRPEAGGDIGRMAQRDLDEAADDAHVRPGDNGEEQAVYVDATDNFPRAGRRPEPRAFRRATPIVSFADTLPPPRNAREKAFVALWQAYPRYSRNCSDVDTRDLFCAVLDEGVAADVLISAAAEYASRLPKGAEPKLMIFWLRVRCWEAKNQHHLIDPVARMARAA
jgi:hypothetical protein